MIFRFTKKAFDKLHTQYSSEQKAANRYCDWFVDIADGGDRKTYFLLTNAFSLFSVVIPTKKILSDEAFFETAVSEIKAYFEYKGLSPLFSEFIEKDSQKSVITNTNSKSVLATMRGIKEMLPFRIKFLGSLEKAENRFKVNDSLNKMPCNCANTGMNDYTIAELFIHSEKMKEPVSDSAEITAVKPKSKKKIWRLYAELEAFKPKIWRRFLVPENFTMADVAFVLMPLFNMDGSHIYRFEIPVRENAKAILKKRGRNQKEIQSAVSNLRDIEVESFVDEQMDDMDDFFMLHELKTLPPIRYDAFEAKLKKLINVDCKTFTFVYDFGDNWRVKIEVEDFDDQTDLPAAKIPSVISGEGLGIIEDCGGICGLTEMREAFKKKSGDDYENYREWLGMDTIDFDSFDRDEINKSLKSEMKSLKVAYSEEYDD